MIQFGITNSGSVPVKPQLISAISLMHTVTSCGGFVMLRPKLKHSSGYKVTQVKLKYSTAGPWLSKSKSLLYTQLSDTLFSNFYANFFKCFKPGACLVS